jgi:hypothetical protein
MMKLSEHSLSVLKNFATINSGIVIKEGSVQKTISDDDSIFAQAEFPETFPQVFGIYDLHQFLGNISALGHPELEFKDKFLTLDADGFSTGYFGCDPNIPKKPPEGKIDLRNPQVSFDLKEGILTKLLKIAATNVLPNLSIIARDGEIRIKVHQKSNPTSHYSNFVVGHHVGDPVVATLKVANLRMLPDDYYVEIKAGAFAKFTSKNHKLFYIVALETK